MIKGAPSTESHGFAVSKCQLLSAGSVRHQFEISGVNSCTRGVGKTPGNLGGGPGWAFVRKIWKLNTKSPSGGGRSKVSAVRLHGTAGLSRADFFSCRRSFE